MSFVLRPGCSQDINLIVRQAAQWTVGDETILPPAYDDEQLRLYSRSMHMQEGPIGIMGVTQQWTGYVLCWALFSEQALKFPIQMTKVARWLIEEAHQGLHIRRMMLSVDIRHEAALRWAEKGLGFQYEGLMRRYAPDGTDHHMLARTWT